MPEQSTDYTWRIDTVRPDGGIIANGSEGDMPEYTRGESVSLTFTFWGDGDGDIGSVGGTFGGPAGMTFGGDGTGGTFGESALADHLERYEAARQYLDFAGAGSVNTSINGVPHFTERLPQSAPVESIVIPVKPGDANTATKGFWGFLKGGDDPTRYAGDVARLQMDFVVLAELDEYDTRADIRAALGGSII